MGSSKTNISLEIDSYRKKPVIIKAEQWVRNGDHSQDEATFIYNKETGDADLREGKLVRYYRHPKIDGQVDCAKCGRIMHDHGWIDTLESGHIVCPYDFIITGVQGERYPCKPDIFEQTYEKVEK